MINIWTIKRGENVHKSMVKHNVLQSLSIPEYNIRMVSGFLLFVFVVCIEELKLDKDVFFFFPGSMLCYISLCIFSGLS